MSYAIINGRRVSIPDSGVYGRDLIDHMEPGEGRRPVIRGKGLRATAIDPNRFYSRQELLDRKNQPVKLESLPDRSKGSFYGPRSPLSKKIITEQVYDIAGHCFSNGIDFDEENADWMVIPRYRLPDNWRPVDGTTTTPLLIVFPTEYPEIPPVGFYLKAALPGAPDGHLYPNAYHGADPTPLAHGWKWYCVEVRQGSWRPAAVRRPGDWRQGDNLWTYFTLVNEVLNDRTS